jgi:hypothetical protein
MTGRHTRLIVLTVLATVVLSSPVDAQLRPGQVAELRVNPEQGSAQEHYYLGLAYWEGRGAGQVVTLAAAHEVPTRLS